MSSILAIPTMISEFIEGSAYFINCSKAFRVKTYNVIHVESTPKFVLMMPINNKVDQCAHGIFKFRISDIA